jgi:hypothetical protein
MSSGFLRKSDRQTVNIDIRDLVADIKRAVAISVGKAMAQMSTPSVPMALNDANMVKGCSASAHENLAITYSPRSQILT